MNVVILDQDLEELIHTKKNRHYRKIERSKDLYRGLIKAINALKTASHVSLLPEISFLHYEKLKHGDYKGKSSVRITNGAVERLIFTENENGIEIYIIELDDTHYGNKR